MGLLNLRLLPQLIQEKSLLSDLDVVAEEECNRELKEDEEISSHSKALFSYPQTSDAEGGVAEDENIDVIFIHEDILDLSLSPLPAPYHRGSGTDAIREPAFRAVRAGRLQVKIE